MWLTLIDLGMRERERETKKPGHANTMKYDIFFKRKLLYHIVVYHCGISTTWIQSFIYPPKLDGVESTIWCSCCIGIDDTNSINKWEKFVDFFFHSRSSIRTVAVPQYIAHFNQTMFFNSRWAKKKSDRSFRVYVSCCFLPSRLLCWAFPLFCFALHSATSSTIPRDFHSDMIHAHSTAYQCRTRTCSHQFYRAIERSSFELNS